MSPRLRKHALADIRTGVSVRCADTSQPLQDRIVERVLHPIVQVGSHGFAGTRARRDLPPFVTPRPTKLTPLLPGSGSDGCE